VALSSCRLFICLQAVEKSRQLRSRIVQALNVQKEYVFELSLAAALLNGSFEQPDSGYFQCDSVARF
jgi:hypothetical protein